MSRFVAVRTASAAGLLLVLSFIIFCLQAVSPGDPVRASLGANSSPAAVAEARRRLGLDDPFFARYWHFLRDLLHGDLGQSLRTHRPVTTDLGDFLPATTELVLVAFLLALLLGALFAVSASLRWPGGTAFRAVLLVGAAAPPFLLALGAILLFYAHLGWLPASGRGGDEGAGGWVLLGSLLTLHLGTAASALQHVLLPALVLSIAPAISIGRILRASLDGTLAADHVRTARAKGLPEPGVLARHVVRNSLGPAVSMAGLQLGFMFAGVVVVEQVFSWPGIGTYLSSSIPVSDFPAIAGVTLVLGAVYIVLNAVVDVLQALADPRTTA
ncbi:peptide/nickel transport system permease protein [Motilibacter rhizosphaerae]|uniref:Peptide/nickel transport system permease protein n=1 Tax=Motilibacter rhizosphaerae TaxID=598652 RepID=A0A4Q7NS84_9ACTN|nr:ABC transporter permease [Motilibacter rhizosphaerae]RZS89710.1 peptide/nickel transport system permease protein [Motilibacter rhizosphaerae]